MKIILRLTILALFVALCGLPLMAQDTGSTAKKSTSGMSAMTMPKPSPEMTKLVKMMSGSWTVTEKHDPNPMMPNGGTGRGTAILTTGPGGLSLNEKYRSAGAMGSFSGQGTFWWDPKAQVYRGVWCDNVTPNGCDAGGTTKWEGDNLVGLMQGEMNGQKMMTRFTYSDFTPTSFVMTMEMGPDENSMKKAMTVTYTKTVITTNAKEAKQ